MIKNTQTSNEKRSAAAVESARGVLTDSGNPVEEIFFEIEPSAQGQHLRLALQHLSLIMSNFVFPTFRCQKCHRDVLQIRMEQHAKECLFSKYPPGLLVGVVHPKDHPMYDEQVELEQCAICWDKIQPHALSMTLHCQHTFHSSCIGQWLSKKGTCPMCRAVIIPESVFH